MTVTSHLGGNSTLSRNRFYKVATGKSKYPRHLLDVSTSTWISNYTVCTFQYLTEIDFGLETKFIHVQIMFINHVEGFKFILIHLFGDLYAIIIIRT